MAMIHELMPLVREEIGAIGKDGRNQAQNYRFRSIDHVLNVLGPILTKHKVSTSVTCSDYQRDSFTEKKPNGADRLVFRSTLMYTLNFHAPDGSTVSSTTAGEGMDYGGDKATNKAMAAGHKYAVLLGLSIPVEDLADSDKDEPASNGNGHAATPSILEQLKAQQSAAKAEKEANFNRSHDEPATAAQLGEIKELLQELGAKRETMLAILQKMGRSKFSEMTYGQALQLRCNLLTKKASRNAPPAGETGPVQTSTGIPLSATEQKQSPF